MGTVVNTTWAFQDTKTSFTGDISCEVNDNNAYHLEYVEHCVNKSDIITFLSFNTRNANPEHINLYTVDKIYTSQYASADYTGLPDVTLHGQTYGSHIIETDLSQLGHQP